MKLSEVSGGGASAPMKLSQASAPQGDTVSDPWSMGGAYGSGLSGSAAAETAKGMVEGVAGLPLQVARSLFRFGKQTPEQYSTAIFAPPKDETARAERTAGDIAGSLFAPFPWLKVAGKVPGAVAAIGRGIERVAPGATERAAKLVERIGSPANPNDIGAKIKNAIGPRFKQFEETRRADFQKWLADQGKAGADIKQLRADDPAFDAAFRAKYKELSSDINEFVGPLAKKATGETSDALSLPQMAFRSRDSVKAFKRLSGDDQAVEQAAREWVARQLHDITRPAITEIKERPFQLRAVQAANAARKWLDKAERDWLHELPEVAKEAEDFVRNFEKVGKAQKTARLVGAGAVLGGAAEALDYHPISRALRLGGF